MPEGFVIKDSPESDIERRGKEAEYQGSPLKKVSSRKSGEGGEHLAEAFTLKPKI